MTTYAQLSDPATIQIPGERLGEKQCAICEFGGVEGKRLSLFAQMRVAPSTPVTVEYNDALFLGEIVSATHHAGGRWHLDIKIEQILTGLESLMNLRANLLGEPVPTPLRMVPAGTAK